MSRNSLLNSYIHYLLLKMRRKCLNFLLVAVLQGFSGDNVTGEISTWKAHFSIQGPWLYIWDIRDAQTSPSMGASLSIQGGSGYMYPLLKALMQGRCWLGLSWMWRYGIAHVASGSPEGIFGSLVCLVGGTNAKKKKSSSSGQNSNNQKLIFS